MEVDQVNLCLREYLINAGFVFNLGLPSILLSYRAACNSCWTKSSADVRSLGRYNEGAMPALHKAAIHKVKDLFSAAA